MKHLFVLRQESDEQSLKKGEERGRKQKAGDRKQNLENPSVLLEEVGFLLVSISYSGSQAFLMHSSLCSFRNFSFFPYCTNSAGWQKRLKRHFCDDSGGTYR